MANIHGGNSASGIANVTTDYQLEVKPANPVETNGNTNNDKVGSARMMSEVDAGTATGTAKLIAPYVDQYYRTYIADADTLDSEIFNYVAQNTGKYTSTLTTMANSYSASGLLTNSANITTINTGVTFSTRSTFPMMGNTNLDCEIVASFSAQPTTNTIIDFGFFQPGAAVPFAPLDGAYFRLNSAGLFGVINSNGTEVTTAVFPFTYVNGNKNRFYISATVKSIQFWINDILYADIVTPLALGQPFMSSSIPVSFRHAITGGAAGNAINFTLNSYSVVSCGVVFGDNLGVIGNRTYGSYQGLSGGTMGSLANYPNNTAPTPAVPTNTTSTVCNGLGGQGVEIDTLAVNTDGIVMSYQVPLGSAIVQGKRLKIVGVRIDSYIQGTFVGGGYNAQFSICFGHTAVSLATTESSSTKAPRRIPIGGYSVPATVAALTQLPTINIDFSNGPIYVNPGEFVAIAKKKVGTVPTSGNKGYTFTIIYAWE